MVCIFLKSIKNIYSFIPIAETALKAIGRTALPLTPPYVVRFSFPTAGHAWPFEFRPIKPDTVLIAVTPSAPPCYKIKTFKFTVCNQTKGFTEIGFVLNCTVSNTNLSSSSNVNNIGNVWCQLGKERNCCYFSYPSANIPNHVVILSTC